MYNFCIFAGTTEGRELVEFLSTQPVHLTACVATEYGETLLSPAENLTISAKRLTEAEMADLFREQHFDLVIDATHPYAKIVTDNISAACKATDTPYQRLLRGSMEAGEDAVFVPDIAAAVDYLNTTEGKILLTTGSKELPAYVGLNDFAQRVYARVLPMDSSLTACKEVGLKPANIIAMQGPFSEEMNIALLNAIQARFLVTKDSGDVGGFAAKVTAAQKAGAKLVIIGRPPQKEGLPLSRIIAMLCDRFGCIRIPEVKIVGIGMGNRDTMTAQVRHAIEGADCLIGAQRMLEAVAAPMQTKISAIAPDAIAEAIRSHPECRRFAVVMSGDVGFFSGTKKLLPKLADCRVEVLPGLSSLVYLCAKAQVSYENVKVVSLHGRDHDIVPDVRANPLVFTLVGGRDGIVNLCKNLCDANLGHLRMTVGQRLSYPDEIISVGTAVELAGGEYDSLSVALIENPAPDAVITHGLPDDAFLRTEAVPMTKSEVRAVALSKLALTEYATCWDIGAGTGSVSIEMALQAKHGHTYAIERKPDAIDLLWENLRRFCLENLTIIPGLAPAACADLPAPTHAFIGGSAGNMKEILSLILTKNPNCRMVATAIALETVAELTACVKELHLQAEIVCLNVSRDRKAGPYHLMAANNPIYIFTMQGGKL